MRLLCDGAILAELLLPRPLFLPHFCTPIQRFNDRLVELFNNAFLTLQDFSLEDEFLLHVSLVLTFVSRHLAPINPPIFLVPVYPS